MKKILLFWVLLLQASFLLAQGSMQLFDHDNNEFVNGQNHEIAVNIGDWETVSPELFVKNISSEDIMIKIRFDEISAPEGTSNLFCGLGNCFLPGTVETSNPFPLAAGQLIGNEGFFSSHYSPNGIEGTAVLRYTYFNVADLNDTISVTFTFNGSPVNSGPSMQLFDHDDMEYTNGQNVEIYADIDAWETVSPELFVKNISDYDINIKIRFDEISVPEGTSNLFCGLGNCFLPGTLETPRAFPLAAGQLIGEEGFFSSHYSPNGILGDAVLRYTYFNEEDLNDTISITFTFKGYKNNTEASMQLFDHENTEFVNGQVVEVMIDFEEWETVSPELFVKNNSDNDINIKIRFDEISVPEGSSNLFCGLGNCFLPGTIETPDPYLVSAGELIGAEGFFSSHYQANGVSGDAVLRYTYFNVDNLNDTISITFHFIDATGINEMYSNVVVAAYPNPANELVNFNFSNNDYLQSSLVIYNILGNRCFEQSVYGQENLQLDLSKLPKGVYLYRLESNGIYSKTSKLTLK